MQKRGKKKESSGKKITFIVIIVIVFLGIFLSPKQVTEDDDSELKCQNAYDGGLCPGLDLVYGEGYSKSCCDKYNLCC